MEHEHTSDTTTKLPTVTRFEVIDGAGIAYYRTGVEVELAYQDDYRTLKVFVKERDLSRPRPGLEPGPGAAHGVEQVHRDVPGRVEQEGLAAGDAAAG